MQAATPNPNKRNFGLKLAANSMTMIQEQASTLNHVYNESNMHSFYDTYVLGNKLGEG